MNTEIITLKNESYTVPTELGGFLIACPVCGKKSNLYDMNEGECPWCQSNIKDTRDRLARILQELDYKIYRDLYQDIQIPGNYVKILQVKQWSHDPEGIWSESRARKIVETKEFYEGNNQIRTWCAMALGKAYAKELRGVDQRKAWNVLRGLRTAKEEKFIKYALHRAIDMLLHKSPNKKELCKAAVHQISHQIQSPYILEVLQRLEV